MIARRSLMAGAAALAAGPTLAQESNGPWVIELFTSQGCSSCPPADALLGRICRRPDLVALSFHVDYWDHIGWKDPFASPATTQRQHIYAGSLKQTYVYTPEMVVDGRVHGPGIDMPTFNTMLAEAKRRAPPRIVPEIARHEDGTLTVTLGAHTLAAPPADVLVAFYDRRHSTQVARGENGGHILDNFNVVRRLATLARWDGTAARWRLPADGLVAGQGVAVLVQSAGAGPMLGAAKLEPLASG